MPRRLPPPWHLEPIPGGYVVKDASGQATRGEARTSSRKRNPERDLRGHDRAPVARHTRISSAAEAALPLWEQAEVP